MRSLAKHPDCARAEGSETSCTRSHIQRIHHGPKLRSEYRSRAWTEAFEQRYLTADLDHVAFIRECVGRKRRLPEKVIVNFFAITPSTVAVLPSSRVPPKESGNVFSQCAILPKRQGLQRPQVRNVSTTESPGATLTTSAPTLSTIHCTHSCPSTIGCGTG